MIPEITPEDFGKILMAVIILLFIIAFITDSIRSKKLRSQMELMKTFGFKVEPGPLLVNAKYGRGILSEGGQRTGSEVAYGVHNNLNLVVFNYGWYTGSGRDREYHTRLVTAVRIGEFSGYVEVQPKFKGMLHAGERLTDSIIFSNNFWVSRESPEVASEILNPFVTEYLIERARDGKPTDFWAQDGWLYASDYNETTRHSLARVSHSYELLEGIATRLRGGKKPSATPIDPKEAASEIFPTIQANYTTQQIKQRTEIHQKDFLGIRSSLQGRATISESIIRITIAFFALALTGGFYLDSLKYATVTDATIERVHPAGTITTPVDPDCMVTIYILDPSKPSINDDTPRRQEPCGPEDIDQGCYLTLNYIDPVTGAPVTRMHNTILFASPSQTGCENWNVGEKITQPFKIDTSKLNDNKLSEFILDTPLVPMVPLAFILLYLYALYRAFRAKGRKPAPLTEGMLFYQRGGESQK